MNDLPTDLPRIIPVVLTPQARRGQMFMHALPGLLLILLGVESLLSGHAHHAWLDILGIAAGLALLIALRRELRSKRSHHSKVGWFEVLAGIVVFLEGLHKLHPGDWFQPGSLTMLLGVAFVLMGIFHHRWESRRRLLCDTEGFHLRIRPFGGSYGRWQDIHAIELNGSRLVLESTGDRRAISLRRVANRREIADAMNLWLAALQAPVEESAPETNESV